MNLLHVDTTSGMGGATRQLRGVLLEAVKRGSWKPFVLCLAKNPLAADLKETGVELFTLSEERFPGSLSRRVSWTHGLAPARQEARVFEQDSGLTGEVNDLLKRWKIDLVHLNTHPLRDCFAARAAGRAGVPTVSHLRAIPPQRRFHYVETLSCRCLAISDFIADRWQAAGLPVENIRVIYNGYHRGSVHRGPSPGGPLRLISVSRMVPWKNHEYLLKILDAWKDRLPEWSLKLVGSGPGEAALRAVVRKRGLESRVHFVGQVPDARPLLADSDLLVHTAIDEPFGGVIPEAMLMGTPAVALRSGGIPEIIDNGVTGITVPVKRPDAFGAAIDHLLRDEEARQAMAQAGTALAASRFGFENCFSSLADAFQRAADGR